ncbi:hypothetical protein P3X46_003166, partial [Hevea brasiliensis]
MTMALQSKNKVRFIDGTLKIILWIDTAAEVWKDLKDRFSQGDIFHISDLQEEIYSFRQRDLLVTDYFTQLKTMWDELENFRRIPNCTCAGQCECNALTTIRMYRENHYVIKFLKGLNEQFNTVRSQIMLNDPLPSINRVFSLVVQQERQLMLGNITESKAFVNKSSPSNHQRFAFGKGDDEGNKRYGVHNSNKVCTLCGRLRHTEATCYRKHGFPPGFKFMSNSKLDFKPNSALQYTSSSSFVLACSLKSFLWLLDTGATDYISFSLSSFISYKRIKPISFKLPYGSVLT